jgi:hypothetical protein
MSIQCVHQGYMIIRRWHVKHSSSFMSYFSEKCAQWCVENMSWCIQKAGESHYGHLIMVVQNGI